jgi:hypothetical protein
MTAPLWLVMPDTLQGACQFGETHRARVRLFFIALYLLDIYFHLED